MKEILFNDKTGKRRKGISVKCKACSKKFITRKDQPAKYCCKSCANNAGRITLKCANCKKRFNREKSKLMSSKSGLYFCKRQCKDQAQKLGGIKQIMPDHYGTSQTSYRKLFTEEELFCHRCGYKEFTCGVDIHHIDEDKTNNDRKNLIPLCKCCHSALHAGLWQLSGALGIRTPISTVQGSCPPIGRKPLIVS